MLPFYQWRCCSSSWRTATLIHSLHSTASHEAQISRCALSTAERRDKVAEHGGLDERIRLPGLDGSPGPPMGLDQVGEY